MFRINPMFELFKCDVIQAWMM